MITEIVNPYGFIYITTNLVNGKRYIGQRKFTGKWENYIGSGTLILKAIKKYGKNNFIRDIVDIGYTKEELNKKEIQWINDYNAVYSEDYYNIASGGKNAVFNMGWNDEQRKEFSKKISESHKGEKSWNYGKHWSNEVKNKISIANNGEKNGMYKNGDIMRGEKNGMYGKTGELNSRSKACVAIDINTKEKVFEFDSATQAGKILNISNFQICSCCNGRRNVTGNEIVKYYWVWKKDYDCGRYTLRAYKGTRVEKPVIQLTLDGVYVAEYSSIKIAENSNKAKHISDCCNGKRQSAKGFKWMFKKDYEKTLKKH